MRIEEAVLTVMQAAEMAGGTSCTAVCGGESVDMSPIVSGVRAGLLLAVALMTEEADPGEEAVGRGLARAVRIAFDEAAFGEEG